MQNLPQGTVSFVFTDIVGSTRLWEKHPLAMGEAVRAHDNMLRNIFQQEGGYVFKTVGDAFCVAFSSPSDALRSAVRVQSALGSTDWGEVGSLAVRAAVHAGPAELREGDYFGSTLNRTARIEAAAHGGQILVSAIVRDLAQDAPPDGIGFRDLGEHRLRSLERPEHLYQITAPGLRVDFPPPRSMTVLPNNLPVQSTSFIGRDREMRETGEYLEGRTRLLTLTGAGGTGKTRLALELGASLIGAYPGGVWLVELAMIGDASRLMQAVTSAVGVREEPGRPVRDTLVDALSAKKTLLVLDNCEHLRGAVAALAGDLLRTCPSLHILATSRHALGIGGELTFAVPPLAAMDIRRERLDDPGLATRLTRFPAVKLFLERAAAVRQDFVLSDENARAVAEICGRLDGIPLAIELAAARTRLLDVRQIAERLSDRFRLLRGGGQDRLPHQQTLQALIDWSHELLTDQERVLLRRLGVFAGGRGLEAIEAVCAGDGVDPDDILDLLQDLVAKSLVFVEAERRHGTRYSMLESVWHYARRKLEEAGETATLRERHARHYLAWAEAASPEFEGPRQAEWLSRFNDEAFNVDAAITWCIEHERWQEGLRFLSALARPFEVRGFLSDTRTKAEAILTRAPDSSPEIMARAVGCAGRLAWALDLYDEARTHFERAARFARTAGDASRAALFDAFVGFLDRGDGNLEGAENRFLEGLAQAEENGDLRLRALCLGGRGRVAMDRGDLATARQLGEESLAIYRALGDHWITGLVLWGVARTAIAQNELPRAEQALCEWAGIAESLGNSWTLPYILETFGYAAIAQGEGPRAARMLGGAQALRERFGFRFSASEQAEHDRAVKKLHTLIDNPSLHDAWQTGMDTPRESLLEEARRKACPKLFAP